MRKLYLIIAMLFVIGCSQATDNPIPVPITPAFAGKDIYPVLYGKDTDADAKDEYFIAAQDFSTSAYSRVQIGIDDFLQDQWKAQRNAVVYMTDGQWGIVAIEDTSQDLELWMSPQNGWDISGVWTLIDDETLLNWDDIDVVSYQNGFHVSGFVGGAGGGHATIFPDVAGNWVTYGSTGYLTSTFDNHLTGWTISLDGTGGFVLSHDYVAIISAGTYGTPDADNQIITDEHGCIWLFDLDATNEDLDVAIFDDIYSIILEDDATLNAITEEILNLAGDWTLVDYNAVCNFADNTIHVVTVEWENNSVSREYEWDLKYYRRDQAGWSSGIVIDEWAFDPFNADENRAHTAQLLGTFPQISIRNSGSSSNIVIYYLEAIPGNPAYRDLRREYLDDSDYYLYATPGEWVATNNIDNSTDDIRFCLTIGNHPEL